MATNILIGVGGTGAKTVEAALVLLMSGMARDPVYVGIVDQDLANGNVDRAVSMLAHLRNFRRLWSTGDNKIDWPKAGADVIATDIHPLFPDRGEIDAIYRPNSAGDSLQHMLGRGLDGPKRHLFNMLFLNDETEQKMALDEGYRGRAHVGSAAFISALEGDENKLFGAIKEIADKAQGQPVNIFLVGSAFGGTGAAGFPTLARRLHAMRSNGELANGSKIRIGGLLMLPYFLFDTPEDEKDVVVRPEELLPKAQLALEYYSNLLDLEESEERRTFDMFYTLGWNPAFPLGYHEPGAKDQTNPALPAELVAATSIVDFFRKMADAGDVEEALIHLSARDDQAIDWGDLPCEAPQQREYQLQIGQLIRFCVYWRFLFGRDLAKPVPGILSGGRNWAHKLAGKAHPDHDLEAVEALNRLIASILEWAAMVGEMASRSSTAQYLWDTAPFHDAQHDGLADPTRPVRLADAVADDVWQRAFDGLIRHDRQNATGRSAHQVFDDLVNARTDEKHGGMGKAVVAVYRACRLVDGESA